MEPNAGKISIKRNLHLRLECSSERHATLQSARGSNFCDIRTADRVMMIER